MNYIIEFDRKGNNDAVFYDCDNHDFTKFVESFGFEENYGSFSDISVIAPALGVAAVNLSSGYYNPHQTHEYVSLYDMHSIIDRAEKMLLAESKQFEYVKKVIVRRKVFGSFVPEGELYVYSYVDKTFYVNTEHEIIVDRYGNFYKYYEEEDEVFPWCAVKSANENEFCSFNKEEARLFEIWGDDFI